MENNEVMYEEVVVTPDSITTEANSMSFGQKATLVGAGAAGGILIYQLVKGLIIPLIKSKKEKKSKVIEVEYVDESNGNEKKSNK